MTPANGKKDKVILYTHGGGYVSGSCQDHRAVVAKFVKGSEIGALLFEYRIAPEHPYPAAIEDSVTVYRWLISQSFLPSSIVIAGESAGGGLCLALLLALREQNIPLPAAAVAISPWTDLICTGESYRTNAKKCLAPIGTWHAFSKHYVGDNDPSIPLISPLYGDSKELPALLIYAGENEIHHDDAIEFAKKAKSAGVDVTLKVGKGMFHCYPVCSPLFPEARQAMDEICTFIKNQMKV
ncbi:MAG TPA: alpha/beta hydrolase [Clostridia bacterium]